MDGLTFKRLRTQNGLSFTQTAYLTNTTERTIRRWEKPKGDNPKQPGPIPALMLSLWDMNALHPRCTHWRERFEESGDVRPYALSMFERREALKLINPALGADVVDDICNLTGLESADVFSDLHFVGPRALDALLWACTLQGGLPRISARTGGVA